MDKWFGKPTIPKQTDKMLEDITKFKGDGTDELTIAELLDFIEEQAVGEPTATKVVFL